MTAVTAEPITAAQLTIVPANRASWADLQAIFRMRGNTAVAAQRLGLLGGPA